MILNGELELDPPRKESKRARYERLASELDAKQERETKAAEFANDPRRLKAIAIGEQMLEAMLFTPEATARDVQRAKNTLEQCRSGCLTVAKQMLTEARAAAEQQQLGKVKAVNDQLAQLEQQKAELLGEEFEPEAQPEPAQPYFTPERLAEMARSESGQMFREAAAAQRATEQRAEENRKLLNGNL
jgi:hypothetical protein